MDGVLMRPKLLFAALVAAVLTLAGPAAGSVRRAQYPQDPTPYVSTTCFYGPNLGYRVWLELHQPADVRVARVDGTVRDYGVLYAGTTNYWFDTTQVSSATTLDVIWTDSTGYVEEYAYGITRYDACHYYPAHT